MRLWRITSALYPVWSADGARLKGGRWNHRGSPAIYAASSYALAVLEVLVHGNIGRVPRGFRYVAIDVPDDAPTEHVDAATVRGWDATPPHASCNFGDAWLRRRDGLVLLVPSVVTHGLDTNAMVNPLHRDFDRVAVSAEQSVQWDERLLASVGR
ncbi:MAG TPA: RES domain-containing protein [Acetobacteraceae bacterium]|jgi:RES domain-containing protein